MKPSLGSMTNLFLHFLIIIVNDFHGFSKLHNKQSPPPSFNGLSTSKLLPTPLHGVYLGFVSWCVLGLCVMVLACVMVCTWVVCHGVGLCHGVYLGCVSWCWLVSWCVLGLCVMVLACVMVCTWVVCHSGLMNRHI